MPTTPTAARLAAAPSPVPHEHGWVTESAHPTSAGEVRYVACVTCGVRRVDLRRAHGTPAQALSREVRA